MKVGLTVQGLVALQAGFAQAPEMAQRELLTAMTEATALLQADVVGNYPAHSGLTRASIKGDAYSVPAGVLGVVGSPSPVASFVEFGTKPHTPPLEPLVQWVQDVLGKTGKEGVSAAKGIQAAIARRGTKARPVFKDALARHEAQIARMFEAAAGRIAAQLGGAGGAA